LSSVKLMDDVGAVRDEITNGTVTDDAKPTYFGVADASQVAKVQILDKGVVIGEAIVQANGDWTFEPETPLASGDHSFQLRAIDAAGNEGTLTNALTFEVAGNPPTPPTIVGVQDDVGTISNVQKGQTTDDTTLTVSGTAQAGTTVTLYDGTQVLGTAAVDK
ncbi:Ig-like domain-containing protein, partial [Comamonas sp. NoAH]|uniref:Ig-like domain-containing protein n=1 Tax=Comamonas halotolerans TaxID=3041496 RepID=UPI0024E1236A